MARGRRMLLMPFLCAAVSFFLSAPAIGDSGAMSCEPRSNTEPGRLNIAAEADGYGLVSPCKARVSLYISENTFLRSIEGVFRLSTPDGANLSTKEARVELVRTDYGMFAAEVSLGPGSDNACHGLSVGLAIKNCQADDGAIIECPDIRVIAPQMFAGLEVSGNKMNICHDY